MSSFTVDFDVTNDWLSGFTANMSITNTSNSTLNGWTLEFDAPFDISPSQIWNAQIVSRQGNHYVIRNLDWNGTIDPGRSISLGFSGSPGNNPTEPSSYILNGMPIEVILPTLSINDVTLIEGNSGTILANFEVKLSEASNQIVTVQYGTANGTATAGSDYTAQAGILTFNPGEVSKIISVPITGDLLNEANETFTINLSNPTKALIFDGQGVGTITDNDPLPSFRINDVMITEGNSGTKNATFTVSLSAVSGRTTSVNFATANGTAVAGSDYIAQSGTLTFNPGETRKTISVAVTGDTQVEGNETFMVNLANASNATIADTQGVATLINDDSTFARPQISINDVSVIEGDSGAINAIFTVQLSAASSQTVSVNYATADDTATAGLDYTAQSGILTFSPGQVSKTITIPISGDLLNEINETFQINLTNPVNATISDAQGIGTITDNDPIPSFRINDVTLAEGNSGTKNATFTVSLSAPSGRTTSVDFATANGTARSTSDYTATSGTLTFAPGETAKTINVAIAGDTMVEPNETFLVNLLNPTNTTIADTQGVGTIADDDGISPLPQISINDISITEGNTLTSNANFTLKLSAASNQTITVNYATANGTAVSGLDYTATSGIFTFNPGETTKILSIPIIGDFNVEPDETFKLNLTNATNATIADAQGIATILNNDTPQLGQFRYGEALQKSILFYDAQRSGDLPSNNRIPWRGDSALNDGADVGRNLAGGYYDAGDHVKFGLPMASALTMLSWGVVEYRNAYEQSGQLPYILDAIKWGTNYILKAHVTDANGTKEFWGQVGNGGIDHAYWGPPESMTMQRPSYKIDRQNPGSDLAAETAAALASASIIFRPTNPTYANQLLTNAIQLYDFADRYRGKYSDSIPDAANYYNSWSGYNDELVWGAAWLYKATDAAGDPDISYLNKAESLYQGVNSGWTQSWDEKSPGAGILLAQETGNSKYRTGVETWLNRWLPGGGVTYTSGGLAWLNQWGSLRYSANTAFLAGIYADTVNDPNGNYSKFAEGQIDYILGDNPRNFSYMVGFGTNYPLKPHHRAASGVLNINDPIANLHILYGAMVGGPSSANDYAYTDNRTDYITNEVAMDYNAGLTGALARMYEEFGGPPLNSITGVTLNALPIPVV